MTTHEPGDNSGIDPELDCSPSELLEILENLKNAAKAVAEATGNLRSRIKSTLEAKRWHKGALSTVRSIDAMSDSARADFLRTFEPMFDLMMQAKWRGALKDLLPDDEEEGQD